MHTVDLPELDVDDDDLVDLDKVQNVGCQNPENVNRKCFHRQFLQQT